MAFVPRYKDIYQYINVKNKPLSLNMTIELQKPLSRRSFQLTLSLNRGHAWHSWLKHCATNRKVADSIPDGIVGIFHLCNPSGHTMALGSTQPLTEISNRNISWGAKVAGA